LEVESRASAGPLARDDAKRDLAHRASTNAFDAIGNTIDDVIGEAVHFTPF